MQSLMPAVLFGMPWRDALEPNAQAEPSDGQLAEPIQGVCRRKGHAVIGPDRVRQPKVLKRALKHRKGIPFLGGRQGFTGDEIAAREIGDGQGIAVPPVGEKDSPL